MELLNASGGRLADITKLYTVDKMQNNIEIIKEITRIRIAWNHKSHLINID